MDIRDAATVLQQVADNFTTGYDGKMLDPRVLFLPCIGKLNPALDCVWQVAITSPMYQRMPDWVPLESKVKTALCVLKAIQHQIACGTIEFGKLYNPGYLEAQDVTCRIFKSIVISITASAQTDYPDLDEANLDQLVAALQAAIDLLEVTKSLLGH